MGEHDFEVFLVVGLMLLAIMLVAFNVSPTGAAPRDGEAAPSFSIKQLDSAVPVGPRFAQAAKTEAFAIDVNNVAQTRTIALNETVTESGLLFGNHDIRYRVAAPAATVTVRFDVVRANRLEPLIVRVNDTVVFSEVAEPGTYEVTVTDFHENDVIIIGAVSSGWKIWAPNKYVLENITLTTSEFSERAQSFVFDVGSELDTLTAARLDLSLARAAGLITITLNGETIFDGVPANAQSIAIGTANLRTGENRLTFRGGANAIAAGTGVLSLFYLRRDEARLITPINLSRLEYAAMSKGRISFKTFAVARDGGLSVHVIFRNETLFEEFATVRGDRLYNFTFSKANVQPGLNLLVIESVDSAVFSVADLDVRIR